MHQTNAHIRQCSLQGLRGGHDAPLVLGGGTGGYGAALDVSSVSYSPVVIDMVNTVLANNWADHNGGYAFKDGLHHVTLKAMLTHSPNAYAIVEVYFDKLKEIGFGKEPSRELKFDTSESTSKPAD